MRIEGFFDTYRKANLAVEKLHQSGFKKAYTDANDHYIHDRNIETNLPGTDSSTGSLSDAVLKSGNHVDAGEDNGPLLAASPMVSGMAGFEEISDYNYVVVVETEDAQASQAKKIIAEMEGQLSNPNVDLPRHLENVDYEEVLSQQQIKV